MAEWICSVAGVLVTSSLKCNSGTRPRVAGSTPVTRKPRSGTRHLRRSGRFFEPGEKVANLAPGFAAAREPSPMEADQSHQGETDIDRSDEVFARGTDAV